LKTAQSSSKANI